MQTIGQKLKAAREEKKLTLEKVFQATRIRVQYLQALEEDDLTIMPSPVQGRGYLRNYTEYLGLDLEQLLEEVRASGQNAGGIIGPEDSTSQPVIQTPESLPAQEASLPPAPEVDSVQDTESQSEVMVEPISQSETIAEEIAESEETPQPDATDSVWQTWLTRIGTFISTRRNRSQEKQPSPADLPPDTFQTEEEPPELPQPENLQPSDEIFREIGAELRNRRETLSLHLDEIERNIHVKAHYLEALEKGAMDQLPSAVQTRGMLSNYASFLDMDVDAILLRFADALQARHREKNPQKPARKPGQPILANMPPLRNFVAGDMIFGIGMAVLLVGFVIWGINRVLTLQNLQEIEPTAPSISDVLLASPDPSSFTATPTFLPVESFPGEATATIIIPTINVNVSVQVNLIANERTYMRVVADGETVFNSRTIPGNAYLYEAEEQVEVLVGNGAAVRVIYNGRDLGQMGGFGEVVHNIYQADQVITPTPLPLPTATNTVPPSPTVPPTSTPIPTRTPSQ
jgi:cytoskeletal protein RodZ